MLNWDEYNSEETKTANQQAQQVEAVEVKKEVDRASMKQTAAARSTAHVPARSVIEDN